MVDLQKMLDNVSKETFTKALKECTGEGVVFRYTESTYLSSRNRIKVERTYTPLKKQSCGCQRCQCIWEDVSVSEIEDVIVFPKNPRNGALYRAVFCGSNNDEGYCDDWHWELEEVILEYPKYVSLDGIALYFDHVREDGSARYWRSAGAWGVDAVWEYEKLVTKYSMHENLSRKVLTEITEEEHEKDNWAILRGIRE